MSVITNKQKTILAQSFIEQGPMMMCIGKPTPWTNPYSDNSPAPEKSIIDEVNDPIAYKLLGTGPLDDLIHQSTIAYAKVDATGTIEYRGAVYKITTNFQTAFDEGYTSVFIRGTLIGNEIDTDIAFRQIGLYINSVLDGAVNDNQVAYPLPDVSSVWNTGVAYTEGQFVTFNDLYYVCTLTNTAGTFNDDLAAGKWSRYNCVTDPGTLIVIDYRKPLYRSNDQSEVLELILPF